MQLVSEETKELSRLMRGGEVLTAKSRLGTTGLLICDLEESLAGAEGISADFGARVRAMVSCARSRLQIVRDYLEADTSSCAAPAPRTTPRTSIKLPELKLPEFAGESRMWPAFWEHFTSVVDSNESLTTLDKYTYLATSLKGPAKEKIAGFTLEAKNYDAVVKTLRQAYGDPENLVKLYYED